MLASCGGQAEATHNSALDEVVRRAGVEKGEEALPLDNDRQQHGVRRPDPCNSVERNHERVSCGFQVGQLLLVHKLPRLVVNVVCRLEVEEAHAHMAADEWLVTIEAKTLPTPFRLFGRRETTKNGRCWRCRLGWSRDSGCRCRCSRDCRGRSRAPPTPLLLLQVL